MSKSQLKPPPPPKPTPSVTAPQMNNNKVIWDCGSTLYDSFELDSFRKQLDSAILHSSRTLSMPRLPSNHHRAPPKKPSSILSRSFHKLLNSVFKKNSSSSSSAGNIHSSTPDPWFFDSSPVSYDGDTLLGGGSVSGGQYYLVYDEEKPAKINNTGLTSIPEAGEANMSPEFGSSSSLVRKTMSARFSSLPPIRSS